MEIFKAWLEIRRFLRCYSNPPSAPISPITCSPQPVTPTTTGFNSFLVGFTDLYVSKSDLTWPETFGHDQLNFCLLLKGLDWRYRMKYLCQNVQQILCDSLTFNAIGSIKPAPQNGLEERAHQANWILYPKIRRCGRAGWLRAAIHRWQALRRLSVKRYHGKAVSL